MSKKYHRTRKTSNRKKGGGTACSKPDNISTVNEEQLVEAILDKNSDLVADILEDPSTINIDYITCDNKSFLELAIESDVNVEQTILQSLLYAKADPLKKNKDGNTSLHLAAKMNYSALITLVNTLPNNSGSNTLIDIKNNSGQTPLMVALGLDHPHLHTVEFLLKVGADANAMDGNGKKVIDYISKSLNEDSRKSLLGILCGNGLKDPVCLEPYRILRLGFKQLSVLPDTALEPDVSELYCNNNLLTEITRLPSKLTILECFNNRLSSLPELPSTLTKLKCDNNPLGSLPEKLPPRLLSLDCANNGLVYLPELPTTLTNLDCSVNRDLTDLPELPTTLITLSCHDTGLKILPQLPPKLSKLVCPNNSFTILPDLPPKLNVLYCSDNSLESLPKLPSSLIFLFCSSNQIQIIPELPTKLNSIDMSRNNLIEPFLSYYTTYERNGNIEQLKESVNNYYKDIKQRGRNESTLRQTLGIQENIGRRRGQSAPNQPNIAASLPANTLSVVSSFLTGKNGPQYRNSPRNKPTQLEQLKKAIWYTNSRKTRKTRKTRKAMKLRKTRK